MTSEAVAQTTITVETPSKRGDIYDRTGTVVLATTVQRERLVASPAQLTPEQRRATVTEVARILGLDEAETLTLRDKLASGTKYVILAHDLDRTTADRVRAAVNAKRAFELSLEPEPERIYPQAGGAPGSTLAAHLIGFVNRDGRGQYGVDQSYQDQLGGAPRLVRAARDASGRSLSDGAQIAQAGLSGADVRLTIDAGLQLRLEQELLAAGIADRAKRVSAVVMDPFTGEIYAMGTYPSYDANDYQKIAETDPSRFIDPVVSSIYEPGSVFKMMTAAAAPFSLAISYL